MSLLQGRWILATVFHLPALSPVLRTGTLSTHKPGDPRWRAPEVSLGIVITDFRGSSVEAFLLGPEWLLLGAVLSLVKTFHGFPHSQETAGLLGLQSVCPACLAPSHVL